MPLKSIYLSIYLSLSEELQADPELMIVAATRTVVD